MSDVRKMAEEMREELSSIRRDFHSHPELSGQEYRTADKICEYLDGWGIEYRRGAADTGIVALVRGERPGKTVGIRADMDALPLTEEAGRSYGSQNPGVMHACGHDAHMTVALGAAKILQSLRGELAGNVKFFFQPAEETTGGARDICGTGIFKQYHVEAIFGLHLWPNLEAGVIASRCQEMMSRSCEVKVDITGRSAHIAKAAEGIDAMAAGVDFYRKACAMEGALPKHIFRLLKFGKLESGTVCNAISGHTRLEGSLRAFQDDVFYSLRAGLVSIGKEVERSSGCTVSIYMNDGYPAVMNPTKLYNKVRSLVDFRELPEPSMITEDFSWYQKTLPGMFFFLGTGNTEALHSDRFDYPEEILVKGADFFQELAEKF